MAIKFINIGFGNLVSANRMVAIVSPESAPIKRIIQDARDSGKLIDATYGRRTRAVIITDSEHVILCAVQPETVAHRLDAKDAAAMEDEEEGWAGCIPYPARRAWARVRWWIWRARWILPCSSPFPAPRARCARGKRTA